MSVFWVVTIVTTKTRFACGNYYHQNRSSSSRKIQTNESYNRRVEKIMVCSFVTLSVVENNLYKKWERVHYVERVNIHVFTVILAEHDYRLQQQQQQTTSELKQTLTKDKEFIEKVQLQLEEAQVGFLHFFCVFLINTSAVCSINVIHVFLCFTSLHLKCAFSLFDIKL